MVDEPNHTAARKPLALYKLFNILWTRNINARNINKNYEGGASQKCKSLPQNFFRPMLSTHGVKVSI
jgi:hypothetical protein